MTFDKETRTRLEAIGIVHVRRTLRNRGFTIPEDASDRDLIKLFDGKCPVCDGKIGDCDHTLKMYSKK